MTDRKTLDKAREWAEWADRKLGIAESHLYAHAAADLIQSLPNEWVDADKLREALDWRDSKPSGDDYDGEFYDRLRALVPAPKPRTLADMTPEERQACQWMQCEEAHFPTGGTGAQGIILASGETSSLILERNGTAVTWNNSLVTPLPDLPKLEWPGEVTE